MNYMAKQKGEIGMVPQIPAPPQAGTQHIMPQPIAFPAPPMMSGPVMPQGPYGKD